jgi:hypothetical protein
MPRKSITFSEEMDAALRRQSKKKQMPIAAIVRYATALWLRRQGEKVDVGITWGGVRSSETEEAETEQGQLAGARAG